MAGRHRRYGALLAALTLLLFLFECSYVIVPQPLGASAVLLEPRDVDGAWYVERDSPFMARYVAPAGSGLPPVAPCAAQQCA